MKIGKKSPGKRRSTSESAVVEGSRHGEIGTTRAPKAKRRHASTTPGKRKHRISDIIQKNSGEDHVQTLDDHATSSEKPTRKKRRVKGQNPANDAVTMMTGHVDDDIAMSPETQLERKNDPGNITGKCLEVQSSQASDTDIGIFQEYKMLNKTRQKYSNSVMTSFMTAMVTSSVNDKGESSDPEGEDDLEELSESENLADGVRLEDNSDVIRSL